MPKRETWTAIGQGEREGAELVGEGLTILVARYQWTGAISSFTRSASSTNSFGRRLVSGARIEYSSVKLWDGWFVVRISSFQR
jgi:hypothetical protein